MRRELEEPDAEKAQQKSRQIALADELAKATREKDTGRGDSASSAASDAPHPAAEPEIARRKRRDTERLRAFNEATRGSEDKRDAPSPAPHPGAQPATERKKLRDTERLRRFNEAARGDEGDSRDEGAADAPAPAGEAKIRRRKRDHDRESMWVSGRDDRRRDDGYGGTPRRNRRERDRDPPRDDGPPRRTRRRDFDRGM